ncbi:uncharacterized protein LOC135690664 [Rhopilema esculentum]|uniref:uncharacterized protein LOC135690664 n=1 Tax=Rhopilema esculentum TaxID=499914 RepID=UPI0031DCF1DE|eukprot:gene2748-967_t
MARMVPNFDEFDSLTLFGICRQFTENIPDTIAWCRRNGLLARRLLCENCHVECVEGALNRCLDGVTWRCPQCRRRFNVRKGSFFEGSKLQLWQVIGLTYFWSLDCGRDRGLSQKQILKELEIKSEHTVVDWKQFCRDVCVEHFLNNPQQIGGPGRIVEIDESLFSKRKYNRGRILPQNWIFGGYDPVDKKGFLVPVPRRDAVTLLPILQTWVVPGSIVCSDMWQAYNQVGNIGYQHRTVNHTYNFVDPVTRTTTNHVEAMWQRAKNKFKSQHGSTNRELIPDYLAEFMWLQRFKESPFYHLWHQIATELYVV